MPTLAGFNGRSLVPDPNVALNRLNSAEQRRASRANTTRQDQTSALQLQQATQQQSQAQAINTALGGFTLPGQQQQQPPQQPLAIEALSAPEQAPEGSSPLVTAAVGSGFSMEQANHLQKNQAVIGQLMQLGPQGRQAAGSLLTIMRDGDAQQQKAAQAQAIEIAKVATFIKGQDSAQGRQAALKSAIEKARSSNKPIEGLVALSNLADPELQLALDRDIIMGTSADKILSGPAKASTAIGKAREDLRAGRITQEEFEQTTRVRPEYQTDIGKLFTDKRLAIAEFGADSPEVRAINAGIGELKNGGVPDFKDRQGLRNKFIAGSTRFQLQKEARDKIVGSAGITDPFTDIARIVGFLKVIDPPSVARESEQQSVQRAISLGGMIGQMANKALNGEKLTTDQIVQLTNATERMYQGAIANQKNLVSEFSRIAIEENIEPSKIIIDYIAGSDAQLAPFINLDGKVVRGSAPATSDGLITIGDSQVRVGSEIPTPRGPAILQADGSAILIGGGQ